MFISISGRVSSGRVWYQQCYLFSVISRREIQVRKFKLNTVIIITEMHFLKKRKKKKKIVILFDIFEEKNQESEKVCLRLFD